jgi:A/G-specific adenine glycosylase
MRKLDQLEALRQELLIWFQRHQRDLPWRKNRDPYRIWLSEIMLQQTRVAAVIPYFEKFLARFPTVESLAAAPEPDLLSHWAGLGYYYRARNLQKAAQAIVQAGAFPATYEALLALPGIGEYTAAAISSIAFNLPHAVLDGNVFRVLSRLFADRTNIADASGKKHFALLAAQLLDRENPAAFNQAMMELGATICLPKSPQCLLCPLAFCCQARQQNQAAHLPVKIVDKKSLKVERTLFWIERTGEVLAWQRPADSRLMPGFWELPEPAQLPDAAANETLGAFKHGITIYDYRFQLCSANPPAHLGPCQWLSLDEMQTLPLSTIFRKAIRAITNQAKPRVRAAASS